MKKRIISPATLITGFLTLFLAASSYADFFAEAGLQTRVFTENSPRLATDVTGALRLQMSYNHSWNEGADTFEFIPWLIWDTEDAERRHGDIQDLAWFHVTDNWELRLGIRKVFWGVVESQRLVDVINQTDYVRNPNGKEKLGQPMINLSLVRDWGIVDLYVLLGHRERIFPGLKGRFQPTPLPIAWEHADYAHGDEEKHVDVAIRWQHYIGNWEWALSHFSGTSRDPQLSRVIQKQGRPWLVPLYSTMDQSGLELQYILDAWILKAEVVSKSGVGDRYTAATAGFEYTLYSIADSAMDLGWIAEYSADDRGDRASSLLENDLFMGGRLSFNDADSSAILFGLTLDLDTHEQLYVLEASKRVAERIKIVVDAFVIAGSRSPLVPAQMVTKYKTAPISRDDYVQLEAVYYF